MSEENKLAKHAGGRPPTQIDQKDFEKLCGLHCTQIEIADWFGCTDETVNNWCVKTYGVSFSAVYNQKKSIGSVSLRRKQKEVAMSGNPTMLIWLGKQCLNQSEKVVHQAPDGKELVVKIAFDPNKV